MTKIKICGLTREEDICSVNEAEPDYCGFIVEVPQSRRSISVLRLRELSRRLNSGIVPVGVFVDAPAELPARLAAEGVIGMIQLHGHEDEAYIRKLRKWTEIPLLQAFSVAGERDVVYANRSSADWILLDHGSGGTGECFDWDLTKEAKRPFFLAGGLTLANLAEALRKTDPWAVDLSSGVETDGKKDRDKILAAVKAVREMKK